MTKTLTASAASRDLARASESGIKPVVVTRSVCMLLEKQKVPFAKDVSKPLAWRLERLNRLTRMLSENGASDRRVQARLQDGAARSLADTLVRSRLL